MSDADAWDAIVIGSGLGGLTAGAAAAAEGARVLVLERLSNFGGAATIYRHGPLTMEASLHEVDGATVAAPDGVFARLNLSSDVEPIATQEFYEVRSALAPAPVCVPHGLQRAAAVLCEALPGSAGPLEAYMREVGRLHDSLDDLEHLRQSGPGALLGLVFSGRVFDLARDMRSTLSERLDAVFGSDEAAKCVVGAPIAYFDDDPAKLSFALFAGVWARYVETGSYYFKGGSAALSLALMRKIKEAGGEGRRKCEARRILVDENGAVAGVLYTDDHGAEREARAGAIYAGAAPAAIAAMLPEARRAVFAERYDGYEPSISLFNISLGLTRPASDFGVSAYSTFVFPDDLKAFADYPSAAARLAAPPNGAAPPYVVADYGRLDAGLRREGDPYFVSIAGVDRFAWWAGLSEAEERARREAWMNALIADADRRFPGLAAAVAQREMANARTMKTRLGGSGGEVYGFRPTPRRLFGRPPSAATGIKGLYLSSAYTISGGYAGAMHGGLMAASSAARDRRRAESRG